MVYTQKCYECPVILAIKNTNKSIDEIGTIILEKLEVRVYYGQVRYELSLKYSYNRIREWSIN